MIPELISEPNRLVRQARAAMQSIEGRRPLYGLHPGNPSVPAKTTPASQPHEGAQETDEAEIDEEQREHGLLPERAEVLRDPLAPRIEAQACCEQRDLLDGQGGSSDSELYCDPGSSLEGR